MYAVGNEVEIIHGYNYLTRRRYCTFHYVSISFRGRVLLVVQQNLYVCHQDGHFTDFLLVLWDFPCITMC
jgi:hypothetical protein